MSGDPSLQELASTGTLRAPALLTSFRDFKAAFRIFLAETTVLCRNSRSRLSKAGLWTNEDISLQLLYRSSMSCIFGRVVLTLYTSYPILTSRMAGIVF